MLDDKTYKLYDEVMAYLMEDILRRTKNDKSIGLVKFSPNSTDHLTVVWAAMYVASFTGKRVELNLPFWEYIKFRIKFRGMKQWFRRSGSVMNVNVPDEIDSVYVHVDGADVFTNGIGCIYDEYYKPRKGTK